MIERQGKGLDTRKVVGHGRDRLDTGIGTGWMH